MKLTDKEILKLISNVTKNHDFMYFMYGIIMTESSGNPSADSGYARGLMQLSRIALKQLGDKYSYSDMFNPELNIQAGFDYLMWLTKDKQNFADWDKFDVAVMYSWGIGNYTRWLELTSDNSIIDENVPLDKLAYAFNVRHHEHYIRKKELAKYGKVE